MGVVNVSETAVVHVGDAALFGPGYFRRSVVAPQSGENVQRYGHDVERYEGDARFGPIRFQNNQLTIHTCNHDQ
jgi:hypothetical protein